MHISELDYPLPEELIADRPVEPRESCKLMVIHRQSGRIEHRIFSDLKKFLKSGDVLALNSAKVVPARMYAFSEGTNGKKFEVLVLDGFESQNASALLNPSRRIRVGMKLFATVTNAEFVVTGEVGDGIWNVQLARSGAWRNLLQKEGHLALPPYILKTRESKSDLPEDSQWYQTSFSDREGAIAAPTAGLHFSSGMLSDLEKSGINLAKIFLKVGLGTFLPIRSDELDDYNLLPENFEVNELAAAKINGAKKIGSRLVAVGTTVVRTLEYMARQKHGIASATGTTDLFVKPPFEFQVVDSLITNFHLPKTSLLALVYAFGGTDLIRQAYEEAVRNRYRFFSYGDAMLIL